MIFRSNVRSAVVKVINTRIEAAEKRYQYSLKELFAEMRSKLKALKAEQKLRQEKLLNDCVESVINTNQ